jgi:choline kinase
MSRKTKSHSELSIIILAAGSGRRMRSHGNKSLIEINHETVLNKQIRVLKEAYPLSEIIIVVGFQSDKIIKKIRHDVRIVENEMYEETNNARSANMGLLATTRPKALIVHGDLIFNKPTVDKIGYGDKSKIIIDSKNRIHSEKIGILLNNNEVVNFSYGNKIKWGQIVLFDKRSIKMFKDIMMNRDKYKFHIFEIMNMMIDKGVKFDMTEPENMNIVEIDSYQDIEKAMKIIS